MRRFGLAAAVAGLALGAAASASCAKKEPDVGGLMLVVSKDGAIDVDSLEISAWENDQDAGLLKNRIYRRGEFSLPNTIAIVSNGDPTTTAVIRVVARDHANTVVDVRDTIVQQVPVDRVAAVPIVLSANCAAKVAVGSGGVVASKCGADMTCDPATGGCMSVAVSAAADGGLETYVPGSEFDSGRDTWGGDSGGGVNATDAADSADTAVADTTVVDTAVADTTLADTTLADTTVADTTMTDTSPADMAVADTGVADTASDVGVDAARCDLTSTYPASTGCAFAPGYGNAFTWPCYRLPSTLGPGSYTVLTVCGDDVVVDARTKLMWARQEEPAAQWAPAIAACRASRRAGFSDWRLPSRQELVSLVDYTKASSPLIDTTKFQGVGGAAPMMNVYMWSSSPYALSTGLAWHVYFSVADRSVNYGDTGDLQGVRCVR
jgi:hypothetical protein